MHVEDQIMYHYHNTHLYSDIWQKGNELIVDDNFNSKLCEVTRIFSTAVNVQTDNGIKMLPFEYTLEDYLDEENFKRIDKRLAKRMLNEAIRILYGADLCKREHLLEEYRLKNYPLLPSRYHSIWLADEVSLDFWKEQLSKKDILKLCKLKVTGELFKSSDLFLPDFALPMEEMYKEAEKYWNPDFSNEAAHNKVEYLFQGKVKILDVKDIKK
jgi:hypothetical protein